MLLRQVFDQLAAEGVLGIPFSADVGGDGLTHPATATAAAIEELGNQVGVIPAALPTTGTPEERSRAIGAFTRAA